METLNLLAIKMLRFSKKLLLFICLAYTANLYAQTKPKSQPLALREVSGIVKDTTDVGLPGVTVKLVSSKDTIVTSTNTDGVFVFKNIKSATYTLSASMLGFAQFVGKFKQNDEAPRIVMDPIVLRDEASLLKEVTVNGTPSITYKTDTVEYKASDYKVRENSTVDELLKKMEGMEVDKDGNVVHQGNNVTKAKVNGKTYLGGDVAQAIQNLPADIVDKIQVVDDYGDEAARTGVKDGDPEKVLNIVTRTDKSVGNMARIGGGVGSNKRYEGSAFGTRINGNQTIGASARLNNTINGVAGSGDNGGGRGGSGSSGGGSGGTTQAGNTGFSYRDKFGKKVEINTNYRFSFNNVNSLNSSFTTRPVLNDFLYINNDNESNNKGRNHNFNFELEANLDSNNYLKITPEISYNSSLTNSQFTIIQRGAINQDQLGNNQSTNDNSSIGAKVFYQHLFAKRRRNFSVQLSLNRNKRITDQERVSHITQFDSTDVNLVTSDTYFNRLVKRDNFTNNYRVSITYVEPLSEKSQLEFNGQVNYNGYDNTALTSNIEPGGATQVIDSLSNIYDYSFTQGRFSVNYRYGVDRDSKVKFSVGVTAVPALLSGTKASLGTSTNRSSLNIIPIARFEYLWSRQHKLQINYSGNANEPSFDQIQPMRDVSNPQNPVVGNPNLKATFTHSLNASYNNYIANSKLNYSVNMNASMVENAVIRNSVEVMQDSIRVFETRFLNASGIYRAGANYDISKQLNDRKYNLALRGNFNYSHNEAMNNNIAYTSSSWGMDNRFGPRINPNDWLEVNPNVGYRYLKTFNTLRNNTTLTKTISLNIDGKFILWESLIFGYSASKNFVSGINANLTNNPLVINSYMTKELWRRRATVTFQAFDILNQNNFVNRSQADDGTITDTKTNALSRYFMLRFSLRLQKWSGMKGRGGRPVMRRGDGSFY